MKITKRILQAKGACAGQVELFASTFPKGCVVTQALCVEHFDKFDWCWAAAAFLPVPAQAEYERVTAPAQAEYNRVLASALAEYDCVTAPALAEYDRVTASAQAEYNRVLASTFGALAVSLHS